MLLGEALVEGDESATLGSRELRKVGVGYLPVPKDTVQRYVAVRDRVRPELVALGVLHSVEDRPGTACGQSLTDQQSQQASSVVGQVAKRSSELVSHSSAAS